MLYEDPAAATNPTSTGTTGRTSATPLLLHQHSLLSSHLLPTPTLIVAINLTISQALTLNKTTKLHKILSTNANKVSKIETQNLNRILGVKKDLNMIRRKVSRPVCATASCETRSEPVFPRYCELRNPLANRASWSHEPVAPSRSLANSVCLALANRASWSPNRKSAQTRMSYSRFAGRYCRALVHTAALLISRSVSLSFTAFLSPPSLF